MLQSCPVLSFCWCAAEVVARVTLSRLPARCAPQVDLKVNKLTSTSSALSYNHYDLPFCKVRADKWALRSVAVVAAGCGQLRSLSRDVPLLPSRRCRFCINARVYHAFCGHVMVYGGYTQPDSIKYAAENLGEHLTGDTIQNSAYKVRLPPVSALFTCFLLHALCGEVSG